MSASRKPGVPGREVLVGGHAGEARQGIASERGAIHREVHRAAHSCAGEQRPPRVEQQIHAREVAVDEVALAAAARGRAVWAVPAFEARVDGRRHGAWRLQLAELVVGVVGAPGLDERGVVRRRRAEVVVDLVKAARARPVVVGVASQHELGAGRVGGDVVRAGGGDDLLRPPGRIGVSGGTAQKYGIAIRAGRLREACARRIVRVLAVAVIPGRCVVRPLGRRWRRRCRPCGPRPPGCIEG